MKKTLAFCLFKYFPHGGQQRDMLRIALACQGRGYSIAVYTTRWEGDRPKDFALHTHRPSGLTNHTRMHRYHRWLAGQLAEHAPAGIVGFNKMPDLDVYFAADSCFAQRARAKGPLFRLTGRYRTYAALEAAVFAPPSATEILLIAEPQQTAYQQSYSTPSQRLHLLPPWIAPDRKPVENRQSVRRSIRQSLGLGPDDLLLLQVGSGFKTKGVDRTLAALAGLPVAERARTRLVVVGRDSSSRFEQLSHRLGLTDNVTFLGRRDDIMELMTGADLLIHPARNEAAGVVLIEALVSGLPVLCSGLCGHAGHVQKAQAGIVLPEPFQQTELDQGLLAMLTENRLDAYAAQARKYTEGMDIYGMPERAADIIESVVRAKATRVESP